MVTGVTRLTLIKKGGYRWALNMRVSHQRHVSTEHERDQRALKLWESHVITGYSTQHEGVQTVTPRALTMRKPTRFTSKLLTSSGHSSQRLTQRNVFSWSAFFVWLTTSCPNCRRDLYNLKENIRSSPTQRQPVRVPCEDYHRSSLITNPQLGLGVLQLLCSTRYSMSGWFTAACTLPDASLPATNDRSTSRPGFNKEQLVKVCPAQEPLHREYSHRDIQSEPRRQTHFEHWQMATTQ